MTVGCRAVDSIAKGISYFRPSNQLVASRQPKDTFLHSTPSGQRS